MGTDLKPLESLTDAQPKYTDVYEPRGAARELLLCKDSEILVCGPVGTGKSRACLEKVHALCLKYPNIRVLVCRKTATSIGASVRNIYDKHVASRQIENGLIKFHHPNAYNPAEYRYFNGSVVCLGGLDNSAKIMSTQYDIIYVCEATELTENDWQDLLTRLRNHKMPYQQIIADCNPQSPHHWLKKRVDGGKTKMLYSRHQDNPFLYDKGDWTPEGKDYMGKLENLTGVRRLRNLMGQWRSAEGIIYDEWDDNVHLCNPFASDLGVWTPPFSYPRYWSIDFGYTNPFVCQFWAQDPDGRLILYREIYKTQTLVEEHAEAIQQARHTKKGLDPMPVAVICDHDAEGRATLEKHLGITTTPAKKFVLEGIDAVKSRLKVQPDGKPRLEIAREALTIGTSRAIYAPDPALVQAGKPVCTQQEMLEYIWEIKKEAPVKANDHGMDALRYMVMHLDFNDKPRFHVITY